jgi:hypothetical protein
MIETRMNGFARGLLTTQTIEAANTNANKPGIGARHAGLGRYGLAKRGSCAEPARPLLHGTRATAAQIITSILLIAIAMTILLQDATTEWLGPRQRPMRI